MAPMCTKSSATAPSHQILVLWGPVTELYALDTEKKVLTLVSQKSGFIKVSHAFAGECE